MRTLKTGEDIYLLKMEYILFLLSFANAMVGKNGQRFLLNVSPMNVLPEPENVSLKWT